MPPFLSLTLPSCVSPFLPLTPFLRANALDWFPLRPDEGHGAQSALLISGREREAVSVVRTGGLLLVMQYVLRASCKQPWRTKHKLTSCKSLFNVEWHIN